MANTAVLLPASKLHVRGEQSRFAALPLPALKPLFYKGLSRGSIVELYGLRSSGKASLLVHILAQATRRGEICAVIDCQDSFHPVWASAAGVRLENLLWVRCRRNVEHAIRAVDLLLHAGGFGVILLDLCETPQRVLQRIPLSYWYRFRRAVEHTPTILLVCAETPQAKACCVSSIQTRHKAFHWTGKAPFLLLRGLEMNVLLRKPVRENSALAIHAVA